MIIKSEFLRTEEAEITRLMREYLALAKRQPGGVRLDNKSLWSKVEARIDTWITSVSADRHLNENLVPRAKEAILHRAEIC